jgi:hypothetical protein
MYLMMTRDSTGDGLELRTDAAGDIIGEVGVTRRGQRTQEWVHPEFCASEALNAIRGALPFQRDADNTERATWIIECGHRQAKLQLSFLHDVEGTTIRVEVDDNITPRDAEQVLNEWFPDGSINRFLFSEV